MERTSEAFVCQSYQIGFIAWKADALVELESWNDISAEIIDVRAFGLPQKLIELNGKVQVGRDDYVDVSQEYEVGLAIFPRDIAQKVLWIWILDAPLLRLRRTLLQKLVERLLWFGT